MSTIKCDRCGFETYWKISRFDFEKRFAHLTQVEQEIKDLLSRDKDVVIGGFAYRLLSKSNVVYRLPIEIWIARGKTFKICKGYYEKKHNHKDPSSKLTEFLP